MGEKRNVYKLSVESQREETTRETKTYLVAYYQNGYCRYRMRW
jgi:hypothetical protein